MSLPSDLLPAPVHEIPLEQIPEVRSRLVAHADQLVTGANGDLTGDAAVDFRSIEAAVNVLDQRSNQRTALPGHFAAALGAGVETRDDTGGRQIGAIGDLRITGDQYRAMHDAYRNGQAMQIETRDVTAPAMATVPQYAFPPYTFRREPTRIASLIPTQLVTAPTVTYYAGTSAASAAATVAEGATKPESNPGWTATTATVRKVAHFVDVSTEALDDYGNFQAVVETEMIDGLINTENAQLLSGDGTGTNLTGLLNASGIQTYAPGSAEARYKSLRHAVRMLRAGSAYVEPDVIVMHPADAEIYDLSNEASAGLHAVPSLAEGPSGRSWGARLVITTGITSGTALVANLAQAAVLFLRETPNVKVDPYSQSDKNLVRFIAEERLALGVVRPTAIAKVTFNGSA